MSDDQQDFDMCECVFSHQFAMRRLLSLLRNGQTVCTDNECMDLVQPQTASTAESADNFTLMIFMFIAAVILYLIRPNSLRRRNNEGISKPPRDDGPHDPNPPTVN